MTEINDKNLPHNESTIPNELIITIFEDSNVKSDSK